MQPLFVCVSGGVAMEVILSPTNKKIKQVASLKQKKHRDESGLFTAEGIRLAETVAASGEKIIFCIIAASALQSERVRKIVEQIEKNGCPCYQVSEDIYHKISDTKEPQGILLVLEKKQPLLADLVLKNEQPFLVVLDEVQDPGNMGTIIRTADAAGCDAVILTGNCADVYAPKAVRATMGSLFHLPVLSGVAVSELAEFLENQKIPLFITMLDEHSKPYFSEDMKSSVAIAFGNEGNGISEELSVYAKERLFIPMAGQSESLNVGTAAAVIIYEAYRQRYTEK